MNTARSCERCGYSLDGVPPTVAGGCRCPECGSLQTGLERRAAWWKGVLIGTAPSAACWGSAWMIGLNGKEDWTRNLATALSIFALLVSVVAPFMAYRCSSVRVPLLLLMWVWNGAVAAMNAIAVLAYNWPRC